MNIQLRCPSCQGLMLVSDELLGKRVQCPNCERTFRAQGSETERGDERLVSYEDCAPSAEVDPDEDRPRRYRARKQRYHGYADEEDERAGFRRARLEKGRSAISAAAMALTVVGALGLGVALVSVPLIVLGEILNARNLPPRTIGYRIGQALFFGVSISWGAIVLSGAMQMKRRRTYGFAMTACVMALLPCNLCWPVGLPIGIWSMIVLLRRDVKDAFT